MTSLAHPPATVLAAFGLVGPAVRLSGGQGTSWRVGEVVLKPDVDATFQEWLGTQLATIQQRGFRLPTVLRTVGGEWVVQGWGAQSVVPGVPATESAADWLAMIHASRLLHDATVHLPRPALLDLRTDPWAWADRAAWGEVALDVQPELREVVMRLYAAAAPAGAPQLVHGDLTNNVLLLPGHPPSIIDFSPYWRPPSYAEGIIVADALCWHAASPEILEGTDVPLAAVARGLLFRILTASRIHEQDSARLLEEAQRYRAAAAALDL